jgi:uncharacterized protein YecE (DUF72 family)
MAQKVPILIGTSGYSYPSPPPKGWRGAFYPDQKPKGFDELKYYSQIFNTCEINSTFYRPPAPAFTKSWATKTPDDFSFAIKLWQKFTHPKKISRQKPEELWEPPSQKDFDEFRSGILPLAEAGKLGALLLQYPASFKCTPENIERVQATLRRFYDYPKVVELRHKSWTENSAAMAVLLVENRASGVLIDEPSSPLRSGKNRKQSVTSFTSVPTAETPKRGGIRKNRGNAMTTCTLARKSKSMRSKSKLPSARRASKRRLHFTTIIPAGTPRQTRSCCRRS